MKVKIIRALSKLGYIKSQTHMFPEYLTSETTDFVGLINMFKQLGVNYEDLGEIRENNIYKTKEVDPKCKYYPDLVDFNIELRDIIAKNLNLRNDFPLMIGGDHSSAIGSIAGIAEKRKKLGVLWVDAHADINTIKTTETGWVYGMPVAIIQGKGKKELVDILRKEKVDPKKICLFGCRYIDKGEWKNIKKWGVKIITIYDIIEKGIAWAVKEAIKVISNDTDFVHVSLDLDSIDKQYAPAATEPTEGGLSYREIEYLFYKLGFLKIVNSMDVVEGEPEKDEDFKMANLVLELIARTLGRSYSKYDMYMGKNLVN